MSQTDQASNLRRLMQQSRNTRTIAIASGKGGVGKSNIALNLAIMLSASGQRVALVDADLGLANLDVLVNVEVRSNLSHVIAGTRRLEDILIDLPSGVQFVPGASGLAKLAHLDEFHRSRLLKDMARLEADNDVIVIDCGAGIGQDVLHFAASADQVIVVTTPEPTAVTDAYAMIKVLWQLPYKGACGLLVNFASDRNEARMTYQRISTVARQFLGAKILDAGYVLIDPKVREAVRRREPFVLASPKSPASKCLAALAVKLSAGGTLVERKDSFFRKVANWFG